MSTETAGIWEAIWLEINPTGHKGVTISALSAIDVACWDAFGRTVGLPLHRVFGACRSEIDTYASSGLWLSASLDELAAEAIAFVARGFRAVKLRIGSASPGDDVARVRAVRAAIGDDVGLLVDANQKFTPKQAIRLGRSARAVLAGVDRRARRRLRPVGPRRGSGGARHPDRVR